MKSYADRDWIALYVERGRFSKRLDCVALDFNPSDGVPFQWLA